LWNSRDTWRLKVTGLLSDTGTEGGVDAVQP